MGSKEVEIVTQNCPFHEFQKEERNKEMIRGQELFFFVRWEILGHVCVPMGMAK